MKKKVSLLLTAIMVLTLVPMALARDAYAESPKLVAAGGTFLYDGLPHTVTAEVQNGTGYTIEYSVNSGKTWTTEAPSLTEAGKLTVNVRAWKGSTILSHDPVTLEILKDAPAGSTITIVAHGSTTTAPIRESNNSSSAKVGSIKAGETCTLISKSGQWYKIKYGSVEGYVYYWFVKVTGMPSGDDSTPDPSKAKLTATGGVFLYDGKEHKVVAELTNGAGFTIEYSVNEGKTWTTTAPSLTNVGKLTVKVRATSSSDILTHEDVVLEVIESIPVGSKLTIVAHGSNTVAPIRAKASSSSEKVGSIAAGETCIYLGKSGSWYHIRYGTNDGYVYYWFVDDGMHKPVITAQPSDVKVVQGKTASFKVTANNAASYQWQYQKKGESSWNDVKINGAVANYSLTTALRHDGYTYRCKVTNQYGSTYSDTAKLTVTTMEAPVITVQPKAVSVAEGAKAIFKVTTTGSSLTYKWQYQKPGFSTWNNVLINGTSATYSLTTAARHNGYKYRCVVSNEGGSVYSNVVALTLVQKPTITTQPKSISVNVGKTATFNVVADGNGLSYQWQYQKPGESTWNKVTINGTSATYNLTTATRHNGYKYRCVVTNTAGSVTSSIVTLTVK